ncbi:alpha/beta hydrolase [Plebeiibacterium sediminum]|uniref:Lysophospholipase n=1 Tax=Plebeiibacterium sediminum TaxID=2992112 RepID=A0AAE3M959_9BACT|nr:alpha/beta fold hydrolase [Plebeiobacterium sediminum]MCW3789291.1 lysophospholipase [Plebeiobacterium sediminum]
MKQILKSVALMCIISLSVACNNANKQQTENTTAKAASSQNLELDGAVGKLKAVLQVPELKDGETCPLVILMHGVFSNKDFPIISKLANELQQKGIASIRFDFNGHGESDGAFKDMTVPLEVKDALAVYQYCKTLDFVSNISLLGHSQGGVVTSLVGGELKDAIKSVVLLAPAAVMEDQTNAGMMMGVKFDPNNIPESISVFNHTVGREYLSTCQTLNIYENAANYEGPVCLIHGRADQVVPYSYSEKYDQIYKNSTLHIMEGETHLFDQDMLTAAHTAVDFIVKQTAN